MSRRVLCPAVCCGLALALLVGAGCDDVRLGADRGRPVITLEAPERGDTLRVVPGHLVAVRGRVEPGVGRRVGLILSVNGGAGDPIPVAEDGAFEAVVPARAGMNNIALEAVNAASKRSRVSRSFHYAPEYESLDAADPQPPRPHMLSASLSDWALDWGSPEDRFPYDPCAFGSDDRYACTEIRDLASLLELALNNVDFSALQPEVPTSLPLLERTWTLDLLGFAEVRVRISGTLDLLFQLSRVEVGQAKVMAFESREGGVLTTAVYSPYRDSAGQTHPGLEAEVSLEATLFLGAWLDIASDDPGTQNTLCNLAGGLCNLFEPHDCLDEYLEACTANPTPLLSLTSGLDAPVLGGLSVDTMRVDSSLDVELDETSGRPRVTLADLDLDLELGALDLSAFEDVTIQLGQVEIAGFDIDLGSYTLPHTFIGDVIDFLTDLLINAIAPLVEPLLGELFSCAAPDNPVCVFIPFLEDMLAAFAFDRELTVPDPFSAVGSLATVRAQGLIQSIHFAEFYGGQIDLAGRVSGHQSAALADHRDDDFLGLALLGGCLVADPGFNPPPTGRQTVQWAPALDLLNMILFSVWQAGGLDLTLSDTRQPPDPAWGVTGFDARIAPWLPPLVNHCPAEALALQWGDVGLDLAFDHQDRHWQVQGFAALELPVRPVADPQQGAILLPDPDQGRFHLELSGILVDGQAAGDLDRERAEQVIAAWLPGLAFGIVQAAWGQSLTLQPSFDISAFPGVEAGEGQLRLGNFQTHVNQGRLIMNGDLVP